MTLPAESRLYWALERVGKDIACHDPNVPRSWAPNRRAEFSAGRSCAAHVLRRFTAKKVAVERGIHGEPLWPPGIVGSITHSSELALACAGSHRDFASLGVDLEPSETGRRLPQAVFAPGEQVFLGGFRAPARRAVERLIISAKESTYKCLFQLDKTELTFGDISVRLWAGGYFSPRLRARGDLDLRGRFTSVLGHWCTICSLKH